MKSYVNYINAISVSTEQHEKLISRLIRKPIPFNKNRVLHLSAGIAACAAVLILCVLTLPGIFSRPDTGVPGQELSSTPEYDLSNTSIKGLPVDNYTLTGSGNSGMEMSFAVLHDRISAFFASNTPDFVFVRVLQTEQWINKELFGMVMQTSTVQILSTVWSKEELPEVLPVIQHSYISADNNRIFTIPENTNLLREGGVYLLPIEYWDHDKSWYVQGDMFVLFEVDDNGLIWSHSQFEGINRFDGQPAGVVADAFTVIASDPNIYAASTLFGRIARTWGRLVEVTVLGFTDPDTAWGGPASDPNVTWDQSQNRTLLKIDNVLSVGVNDNYSWFPKDGDEIAVFSYGKLEQGARFLMLLDPSEDGPYVDNQKVARINDDGTITALIKEGAFAEFNGRTVEYMKDQAERAIEWYLKHMN